MQERLDATRPTGYTTVLKLLQIMTDKGLVKRNESERLTSTRRWPRKRRLQKQLGAGPGGPGVRRLGEPAGAARVATRKTSRRDLARIRELLDELEGGER